MLSSYNKALEQVRIAKTLKARARIADIYLDLVWRNNDETPYKSKAAPYTLIQLEKVIDRCYVQDTLEYGMRRAENALLDDCYLMNDDDYDRAIDIGASVYVGKTSSNKLINFINSNLSKKLTYGQSNRILNRLHNGNYTFPVKPHSSDPYSVILALMIKHGKYVRREYRLASSIHTNISRLKFIIFTLLIFYACILLTIFNK
jgi:hypothetical protein